MSYMNRATCGLQNSDSPTSDDLTPQETTNQELGETGLDGGSLPCPGSSAVAESGLDNYELIPLTKSPTQSHSRNTQHHESVTNEEDEE